VVSADLVYHNLSDAAVVGYFDGSTGKNGRVTLGGYLAPPATWKRFSAAWQGVLANAPAPCSYLHMVEAHARDPEFSVQKGWTEARVEELIELLLNKCLRPFALNESEDACLIGLCCSIPAEAWEEACRQETRLKRYGQAGVCARFATALALRRLPQDPDAPIGHRTGSLAMVFDRGERFKRQVEEIWERALKRPPGRRGSLSMVSMICEDNMRTTPGLQAADFLAWHVNRWQEHLSDKAWWRTLTSGPGATFVREFNANLLVEWCRLGFDRDALQP
jgi:hypothetical protein